MEYKTVSQHLEQVLFPDRVKPEQPEEKVPKPVIKRKTGKLVTSGSVEIVNSIYQDVVQLPDPG